ncbi:MAG: pirin family protein [Bdellovibrionaceae bacterium]|nr:pirin family protein [Bdellovibrionales bacterium]MCB9085016.1 pirin family protein [Pseudobdellovibrionaceae bacterium]
MRQVRKSEERGRGDLGWLKAKYSFSFADYFDRNNMGFRTLRVINQDVIQPLGGFATHPHQDMEILTYVIRGAVAHKDSMENSTVIPAGEVQLMSAGTGVEHSEFNPSDTDTLELLQIWMIPDQKGYSPTYQQMQIDRDARRNDWLQLAGPGNRPHEGMLIRQQLAIYTSALESRKSLTFEPEFGGNVWLQVVDGQIEVEGESLEPGDGLALTEVSRISVRAINTAEFLVFDLS